MQNALLLGSAIFSTCTIDAVGRVSAKRVTRQCGDRIVGLRLRLTRPTSCLPDVPQSNRPRSQERQHLRLNRTGRIFFELIATSSLKASDGFTRLLPSVMTVTGYAASFYLLSLTLKRMEVSVVYAIWSGAGTALMALVGYFLFAEQLSPMKVASIGLIVLGVVGLNLAGKSA